MKVNQLKTIIKQAVKEAIQEEMKDILLEAIKTPKAQIQENTPIKQKPLDKKSKKEIRENYMSVLNGMKSLVKKCNDFVLNMNKLKVIDIGCNDGSLLNFFRDIPNILFKVYPPFHFFNHYSIN